MQVSLSSEVYTLTNDGIKTKSPHDDLRKDPKHPEFWPARAAWQDEMRKTEVMWPSMILVATYASISVLVLACPGEELLTPFKEVFGRIAVQVLQNEGKTYSLIKTFHMGSFQGKYRYVLEDGFFPVTGKTPPGTLYGATGWATW